MRVCVSVCAKHTAAMMFDRVLVISCDTVQEMRKMGFGNLKTLLLRFADQHLAFKEGFMFPNLEFQ